MILLYFPFENSEMESTLPVSKVIERIIDNIETKVPKFSLFYSGDKHSKGEISEERFLISRIIRYQNSFLPIIEGTIYPYAHGSRIKMNMRLKGYGLITWIIWMALALLLSLGFLPFIHVDPNAKAGPLFGLVGGYFVCIIPFNFEVNKAKRLIEKIINN